MTHPQTTEADEGLDDGAIAAGTGFETQPRSGRIDPLTAVTSGCLAALFALLVSGLLLAMANLHHAYLQAPLALVIGIALYRQMPRRRPTGWPRGVVAVVLFLAVGLAVFNAGLRSELVLSGRDGATYGNTASFLVEGTGLFPAAVEEPFVDTDLDFDAPGFVPRPDGTFWQQFLHATPALYAFFGEIFGKPALFSVNALVSGVGLLAMFLLASRLMAAWWAVLAATLTAVSLPYVYYSRGTFSEMAALTLSMGGIWAAHVALTASPRHALAAGLLLGGAVVVRVDSWMMGISLGAFLASVLWMGERSEVDVAKRMYLGFAVGGTLSLIDLVAFAEPYLVNLGRLIIMVVVAAAGARLLAPLAAAEPLRQLLPGFIRRLGTFKAAATATLFAGATYLWLLRPLVTTGVGNGYDLEPIQIREGLPLDPTRSYAELSGWWIAWYVGIPIMVLGIVGMVMAARRSLEPGTAARRMVLFAFLVPAATYLYRPSINPDQIWAIRRFLPVVIPLLIIFAVATIEEITSRAGSRHISRTAGAVLALLAAVPLLVASEPLIFHSDRAGMGAQIVSLCDRLGDSQSVLIVDDLDDVPLSWLVGPPLRSWCHVSVAAVPVGAPYEVTPDVIIASEPQQLPTEAEGSHEFSARTWVRSLRGAPQETTTRRTEIWIDEG